MIDRFLDSIPADADAVQERKKRKPTPADAAIDYVSYLIETEGESFGEDSPVMKGQDLIDNFINNDGGRIELKEEPEYVPELENNDKKRATRNILPRL